MSKTGDCCAPIPGLTCLGTSSVMTADIELAEAESNGMDAPTRNGINVPKWNR